MAYSITSLSPKTVFDKIAMFEYIGTDNIATTKAINYFTAGHKALKTGDYIYASCSDGSALLRYLGTGNASTVATFA